MSQGVVLWGTLLFVIFIILAEASPFIAQALYEIPQKQEACHDKGFDKYVQVKTEHENGIACCRIRYNKGIIAEERECEEVLL